MRAILGRLSDLGIRELFKLLTSVQAEGTLDIETPAGAARLLFVRGHIGGMLSAEVAQACAGRNGSFSFHPGTVPAQSGSLLPVEEFLAWFEAAAPAAPADAGSVDGDPLAELRDSLERLSLPRVVHRVAVISADPRPYRTMETEWRQRGWELLLQMEPSWPAGLRPSLLVLHLPSSATLAGQGEAWVALARLAAEARPPVPVIWAGGLADPWLRHEAVAAGVDFLLPAPAGEAGEAARWFREDLTLVADRLLGRPAAGADAEGMRDFFLALQADADPAEVRASLLRLASTYFGRGALLAVHDDGFESLGVFGLPVAAPRVPRGVSLLELAVVGRRTVTVENQAPEEGASLASALGWRTLRGCELFPAATSRECVAVLVGDEPTTGAEPGSDVLAALLARSGEMIGLKGS